MDATPSTATVPFPTARSSTGQGRPRGESGGDVPTRLFAAAQNIIQEKGHFDVTDKEIAKAAGVSVAMINYYFESKDGLLFALVDQLCCEIAVALREVEQQSAALPGATPNATRALIKTLVTAYYSRPAISRILLSEIGRESSIVRLRFIRRYGSRGMESLQRMFDNLVGSGVYGRKVDTGHAALALLSILNAPLLITQPVRASNGGVGPGLDDRETERWIDYVTDLFDRQFRNA